MFLTPPNEAYPNDLLTALRSMIFPTTFLEDQFAFLIVPLGISFSKIGSADVIFDAMMFVRNVPRYCPLEACPIYIDLPLVSRM
jgi:hypothetical protein